MTFLCQKGSGKPVVSEENRLTPMTMALRHHVVVRNSHYAAQAGCPQYSTPPLLLINFPDLF